MICCCCQPPVHDDSRVLLFRSSGESTPELSTAQPDLLTAERWEKVRWGRRLGTGSFAEIWSADLSPHGPVAIKVLRDDRRTDRTAVADISREAGLLCRLRHPHILCSLGVYEPSDGPVSIVLQRIDSTLAEQINHPMHRTPCDEWFLRRHWPIERAILVGTQLASALAYMHEKAIPGSSILHRDLKPDNVGFVGGGPGGRKGYGRPVLFDLGCACIVAREPGAEGRSFIHPDASAHVHVTREIGCLPHSVNQGSSGNLRDERLANSNGSQLEGVAGIIEPLQATPAGRSICASSSESQDTTASSKLPVSLERIPKPLETAHAQTDAHSISLEINTPTNASLPEVANKEWQLTGQTGAARYMAPEVYLCQPYGLLCETYSFALVLWHMLTKEPPYDSLIGAGGMERFERCVIRGDTRPPIQASWPSELRQLLRESLRPAAADRPTMHDVALRLRRLYLMNSLVADTPLGPLHGTPPDSGDGGQVHYPSSKMSSVTQPGGGRSAGHMRAVQPIHACSREVEFHGSPPDSTPPN